MNIVEMPNTASHALIYPELGAMEPKKKMSQ